MLEDGRLEGYACPHRGCTGLCAKHRTNPWRRPISAEASSSRASEGSECTQSSRRDKVDAAGAGDNEKQESTSSRKIWSKTKKKKDENTGNQKADDSDVLVAGEPPEGRDQNYRSRSDDEADGEGIMTCDNCGATRDSEETEREGMAIQELLERSQAVAERRVDFPSALKGLEEARVRALSCLYRGNWMVAQIYAALVSVALDLEVRLRLQAKWSFGSKAETASLRSYPREARGVCRGSRRVLNGRSSRPCRHKSMCVDGFSGTAGDPHL